jgi:hypothetical protein
MSIRSRIKEHDAAARARIQQRIATVVPESVDVSEIFKDALAQVETGKALDIPATAEVMDAWKGLNSVDQCLADDAFVAARGLTPLVLDKKHTSDPSALIHLLGKGQVPATENEAEEAMRCLSPQVHRAWEQRRALEAKKSRSLSEENELTRLVTLSESLTALFAQLRDWRSQLVELKKTRATDELELNTGAMLGVGLTAGGQLHVGAKTQEHPVRTVEPVLSVGLSGLVVYARLIIPLLHPGDTVAEKGVKAFGMKYASGDPYKGNRTTSLSLWVVGVEASKNGLIGGEVMLPSPIPLPFNGQNAYPLGGLTLQASVSHPRLKPVSRKVNSGIDAFTHKVSDAAGRYKKPR